MSRNEIPSDFPSQQVLLTNLHKKVTDDGEGGELVAFLEEKGIVLSDDVAKGVLAAGHHTDNLAYAKKGQKYCSERDVFMMPVITHFKGSSQFLKAYYTPETKSLGDWGILVTIGGKITLPTDVEGWSTSLDDLNTQNESYESPEVSPLVQYLTKKGIILADDIASCASATLKQTAMTTAKSSAGVSHHDMVIQWSIPLQHIRTIGVFLMKLHAGNEQYLTDYGYKIVESAKVLKTRNIKIPFGFTRLKQKAKLGGAFINTGTETLHIYAGKTIAGIPIILLAGAKLIVPKGYSSFCVTNTSATISAKLQVVPPKQVD